MSENDFLEFERKSDVKHEFLAGEVFAMAGGTPRHAAIAMNVGTELNARLGSKPCFVVGSDLRTYIEATGLYTYPDVTVVCWRPRYHPKDKDTLLNPTLIVEVLSESTEAYDRGQKFAHYRTLDSLKEYVLVAQAERRVEHYRRLDTGQWVLTEYREGAVTLPALDVALPLDAVYAKLDLLDEGPNHDDPA